MSANFEYGKWLSTPDKGEEVIISGMAGRFPKSENLAEFKENLMTKEDMITDGSGDHTTGLSGRSGRIANLNRFDGGFFGLHYKQSKYLDPMIRILQETAVECLIDAGINPKELEGSKTGVFIGCSGLHYEIKTMFDESDPDKFRMIGNMRFIAAHQLSYFLKLKGPSYTVDSACSSTLNALEHAFKSIRSGECDNAIVGGMSVPANEGVTRNFFRIGVLTLDGIPKVFDEKASGYVRSGTMGCLFLQKSKDARRIYGTIIHAKTNDDGYKTEGITFPSSRAQCDLMEEVYLESGLDVNELSYFEAHATGTKVGDPTEVEAIDKAIGKKRNTFLWVGSVKSNLGHSEYASAINSICKVLLAFETGTVSPNIHFQNPRSDLEAFSSQRLQVVTENLLLTEENALVGVNNFGFGGNNAHTILRRHTKNKINLQKDGVTLGRIICVSGRTEEAVHYLIQEIKSNAEDLEYLALLQHIFSRNMYNHSHRGYVVLNQRDICMESIKFHNELERTPLNLAFGDFDKCYKNVGRYLLDFPVFYATLSKLNQFCIFNFDILEIIHSEVVNTSNDIKAGFCVQIGIMEIFKVLGLQIENVLGISIVGQLSAVYFNNEMPVEAILNMLCKEYSNEKTFETTINGVEDKYECLNGYVVFSNNIRIWNALDVRLSFLELLGSLYQKGHELKLFELYNKIDFPVSRSTPMISPSILWDHSKQWETFKYEPVVATGNEERTFKLNCKLEEDKYLLGHVVDGRNLFPAIGYLWLVWNTLALIKETDAQYLPVVFESCRFVTAVNIPSDGKLQFSVTIQLGLGSFEVIHDDIAVVTGKILVDNCLELHEVSPETLFSVDDPDLSLNQEEIYLELNLRGYNYSGLFRAIQKSNLDASKGVIRWDNNWVTLIDNMLQLHLFSYDTRLLYVPISIERLSIDPVAHLKMVKELGEKVLLPVSCCKSTHTIKSGAIQVTGVLPSSIQRRKYLNDPVLEKYMFVPNVTSLKLRDGLRVVIQLILENSQAFVFNAVEKFEDEPEPLLPVISEILQDLPLIKPDLTLSTTKSVGPINSVKIEPVVLTEDSKLLLVIGSKIRSNSLLISYVQKDGYILSREDDDFDISFDQSNVTLLLAINSEKGKLMLLRKNVPKTEDITTVKVTSENFNWIPELQKVVKDGSRVVVFSQNEPLSGILGLINCLRREKNGSNVQCVFITDVTAPEFDVNNPFYKEQLSKCYAFNIYKDSTWGTYRHLVLDEYSQQFREHAYVNILDRGNLTSLTWLEGPLCFEGNNLGNDEKIVIPYYCSLNFRDIVVASGRINTDAYISSRILQECLLGYEFAGRTEDGERVMGVGKTNCLASIIRTKSNFLFDVPYNWSLEDAASAVAVYMTVIYGLILRNKCLQSGKSILIHCGAGGIGLAAINMALHYNMQIFTTVGTREKRDFIMKQYPQLKESQVGNSRDTSFVSMIKKNTNGRGVDVVLNSLTGEKLYESINCLAYGGSFIEIGKFDMLRNSSLHLRLMAKEASFHGIMVDHLIDSNSEDVEELAKCVDRALSSGVMRPIPRTVFPENKIEDAFRYMMTGKHVGKVIVRVREEEPQKISMPTRKMYKANPRFFCNPGKVQIIIGGLGGVGLELTDWLMLRGAKILLISTRNGITSSYQQQRIDIWASYCVKVVVSTADITTRDGCEELIQEAQNLGNIEGIFNLAVVLKDTLFENQTQESFDITFGPKARAVQYLDEITRQSCPDLQYFVIFSSVACGRGNPGQTNYAMANSIMERICEKRKEEGFPALAIQWGAIGDVGLVAKMQKELKILEISGTLQQRISNCISLMDRFMNQDHPIVSSMVVAEKKRQFGSGSALEAVAHVLGIKDLSSVVSTTPLSEFGMDSLTGAEVYLLLEKEFEIYMKPEDMKNLTFEKLRILEAAKASADNNLGDKTTLAMTKVLKFLPYKETGHLLMMEMLSNNNNIAENEHLVFVLPGIEGLLSDLEDITQCIGAKVQGFQYSYKDPVKSVPEIANGFLPHIVEKLGNSRTFYIMAYSFGVLVALEIAHSLESKGYQGTIFAIDGSPAYIRGFIQQLLSSEDETVFQIRTILHILQQILPIDVMEGNKDKIINAKSEEERIDIVGQLLKRTDSPNYDFEKMAFKAVLSRYQATQSYGYSYGNKLKSFVKLYKVSQPMIKDLDKDYGLSQLIEKKVEVLEFDADHISVLKEVSIADDINNALAKDTTTNLEI